MQTAIATSKLCYSRFFIYKVHIRNTGGQNERKRRWCDQKNGYNTTSKGVSEIRHVSKNTQQLSKWKIFRFMQADLNQVYLLLVSMYIQFLCLINLIRIITKYMRKRTQGLFFEYLGAYIHGYKNLLKVFFGLHRLTPIIGESVFFYIFLEITFQSCFFKGKKMHIFFS